ncbi:MAG: Kelch repeat-containing protein, partial [Actinomycetota bacterium]
MIRLTGGEIMVFNGSTPGVGDPPELFNPSTGKWRDVAMPSLLRGSEAVLLVGPRCGEHCGNALAVSNGTAELFDPGADGGTGQWSVAAPPSVVRTSGSSVTLLADGRVMVAGGTVAPGTVKDAQSNLFGAFLAPTASVEIFDPQDGTWAAVSSLDSCQPAFSCRARSGHTAIALADGRVLVFGGLPGAASNSAQVYSPGPPGDSGSWAPAGSLNIPRAWDSGIHPAVLLRSAEVLVAGGLDSGSLPRASAEIFNPVSGTWRFTRNPMWEA